MQAQCEAGKAVLSSGKAPKTGLRASINAMCRQCLYDPHAAGNWRQQVEACTSPGCALYAVRPRSSRPLGQAVEQ